MKTAMAILATVLAASTITNSRASSATGIFLLKVPELKLEMKENTAAPIASSFVSRLELQVSRSSQEIPPGKILVLINGVAASTIMSTHVAESSISCDLDLYLRPGFLLHAGRNSVEVITESIYLRPYYATFLLDVQGEPESLRDIQQTVTRSQLGEQPPLIHLLEPQGVVEYQNQLKLQGYLEGGVAPLVLCVQGEVVRLAARTHASSSAPRGVQIANDKQYSFEVPIKLASTQDSIELTAIDAHHNTREMIIPVIQRKHAPKTRYAVVIGISSYHDSNIPRLQFADRDAESIKDFLLDPNGGAVPSANLLFLKNEKATFAQIHSALFDFLTKPGPDDLVVVYFAGHGTNDFNKRPDNYYLVAYDTDAHNLGGTAIAMWDLQIAFERTLQADVVSLIDACHSGGIAETKPNMTNQRWLNLGYGKHRAIITASRTSEFSREGPQWGGGHGVFTFFLLQGLRGAAVVNRDQQLSVGELFNYVRRHVAEETNGAQTPTALSGLAGGLVITRGVSKSANHGVFGNQLDAGGYGQ
ncbi:MAG TPA: caspase family protein [Candidatus Angelobacter sp.]|nr:caspase family protein [Candidatus Angelobacter sp.]